jgi:SAM-dependent methyltransferase
MGDITAGHTDRGLQRVLSHPLAYSLFRSIVATADNEARLVREYVRPSPGCRILDIGCGPASIVAHLPDPSCEYVGFDMNPAYIASAMRRWRRRGNCTFLCGKVGDTVPPRMGLYDVVVAIGVLHHLNDEEALRLLGTAHDALKPGGALVTRDGVYVEGQHWLARWLISRDRGRAVRTAAGYRQLASRYFPHIEERVLHDTLRLPYTVLVMRCRKTAG